MKKLRLLAWLITLTMLCELLPLGTFAQSDIGQSLAQAVAQNLEEENSEAVTAGKCGNSLTWSLSSDGTLTISGTGDMYDFGYNEYPCPWRRYENNLSAQITHVVIENGVTSIGNSAFYQLTNLADVVIPEGITRIGNDAFSMCSSLPEVALPSSLSSLGTQAFALCSALTGIDFPSAITEIPHGAFESCTSLQYADLPNNLSTISSRAFFECTSLAGIVFPDSLIKIGELAFCRCRSLRTIIIPSNVAEISNSTFAHCEKLTKIVLPDSVTAIGSNAFSGCALEAVTLPSELTNLGNAAFSYCPLFFVSLPSSLVSIPSDAFAACHQLKSIYIPISISFIHQNAFADTRLADVYYEGDELQWDSLVTTQHLAFDEASIHYNSINKKPFLFGQDNFSFEHSSNDFFNGSISSSTLLSQTELLSNKVNSSNWHLIFQEDLNHLRKGLSARAAQKVKKEAYSDWHGSCYGLSLIAMLHYCYPERLPLDKLDYNVTPTIYHLVKPADSEKNTSLINYYYLTQYLPSVHNFFISRGLECMLQKGVAIKNIINSLKDGVPVFISLGDHAVVLLSVLSETNNQYIIRVFDPNVNSDGTVDQTPAQMTLYKDTFSNPNFYPYIKYGEYSSIKSYIYATEFSEYDCRNYFYVDSLITDSSDYSYPSLSLPTDSSFTFESGNSFFTIKNGELYDCSNDFKNNLLISNYPHDSLDESSPTSLFAFDSSCLSSSTELILSSSVENGVDLLLNDTLLSISTSGPVSLTYNEEARTVDVAAEAPTDVNLLMTKNDVNESWPWHSWALDTTGTTTLHADLDDDGLHLSGDGITNAKYATENADTENVDSGTISVQPDADGITAVTITNKKSSSGDSLEIVTPSAPTTGNAITITNGFAYIDDPEQPVNSAALGDVVTIVANDRSSEGKTFTGWVVNSGNVTLDDSSASPTSFTMGDKAVSITAQYSTNSTPPPTPGGGSSSGGGGGGGGGGAAVLIGVGAAAAITAGVIMMSPVDVKGRVVLADLAAVPGAKISLLREGKVVAQTTADENGSFALKAKRGNYELTVAYTDANGQLIHKTIDIKAPAKDLTVTF